GRLGHPRRARLHRPALAVVAPRPADRQHPDGGPRGGDAVVPGDADAGGIVGDGPLPPLVRARLRGAPPRRRPLGPPPPPPPPPSRAAPPRPRPPPPRAGGVAPPPAPPPRRAGPDAPLSAARPPFLGPRANDPPRPAKAHPVRSRGGPSRPSGAG